MPQGEEINASNSRKRKVVGFFGYERSSILEDRARQKVLRASAEKVFWDIDFPDFTKSFLSTMHISSERTVAMLRNS